MSDIIQYTHGYGTDSFLSRFIQTTEPRFVSAVFPNVGFGLPFTHISHRWVSVWPTTLPLFVAASQTSALSKISLPWQLRATVWPILSIWSSSQQQQGTLACRLLRISRGHRQRQRCGDRWGSALHAAYSLAERWIRRCR